MSQRIRAARALIMAALIAFPGGAQTVDLYSEFMRFGPDGEVVGVDRTENPREILSPAVVRGGYASFQVVVRAQRGNYFLFTASNPTKAVQPTLWRERFVKQDDRWIPDVLAPTRDPIFEVIPDPEAAIPRQSAQCYLLDVWVPRETPAGRLRVEVQLKAGSWTIYPMEFRVLTAILPPAPPRSATPLPGVGGPSADAALGPIQDFLAGKTAAPSTVNVTRTSNLRDVIRRNVEQDMALAPKRLVPVIQEKLNTRAHTGEWYLAIRDLIYREVGGRE
jgi:hypothetical protein